MPRARAFTFHGIGSPNRALEPGERPYWLSKDEFDALISQFAGLGADREIMLTFDDGNRSDIEIAAPTLARHGLTARIFVVTGRLGAVGSLDAADVRNLHQQGFSIGSHGIDHVDWSTASPHVLAQELSRPRVELQDITGVPVTEVAIPFGRYNKRVLRAIRDAGYAAAWTSDGGEVDIHAFLRPRLSIRADMVSVATNAALLCKESFAQRLRRRMAMLKKRLL